MSKELIHIKFEQSEALNSKKQILLSEKTLIEIMKTIRNYKELRKKELIFKTKLQKKILETLNTIKKLQNALPKETFHDLPKKQDFELNYLQEKIKKAKEQKYNQDLENELRNIQEKLRSIGQ